MSRFRNPLRNTAAGPPTKEPPAPPPPKPKISIPPPPSETTDTLSKVSGVLLLFTFFLLFSRGVELMVMVFRTSFSTMRILAVVLLITAFLTGGFYRAFQSVPIRLLSLFTIWLMGCTPLSVWIGGSAQVVGEHWFRALAFAIVSAAFTFSSERARKVLISTGAASVLLAILVPLLDVGNTDRLQLVAGSISNPNDLALYLIGGIPGCILLSKSSSRVWKLAGMLAVVGCVVVAVQTGSRMGAVIMAAFCVIEFFRASMAGKLKLIVVVTIVGILGASFASRSVWERYRTIWSRTPQVSQPDEETDASTASEISSEIGKAAGSTDSRIQLLKKSVEVTLEHPLFGVGPGMFGVYVGGKQEAGEKGLGWRQTHNTYTQISSETGIPGLLIYLGLLGYTLRSTFLLGRRLRRDPALKVYANIADAFFQFAAIYAVGCMFGSFAYGYSFPMIAAAAGAFEASVRRELGPVSLPQPPQTVAFKRY